MKRSLLCGLLLCASLSAGAADRPPPAGLLELNPGMPPIGQLGNGSQVRCINQSPDDCLPLLKQSPLQTAQVPAPGTLALLGVAAIGALVARRRK